MLRWAVAMGAEQKQQASKKLNKVNAAMTGDIGQLQQRVDSLSITASRSKQKAKISACRRTRGALSGLIRRAEQQCVSCWSTNMLRSTVRDGEIEQRALHSAAALLRSNMKQHSAEWIALSGIRDVFSKFKQALQMWQLNMLQAKAALAAESTARQTQSTAIRIMQQVMIRIVQGEKAFAALCWKLNMMDAQAARTQAELEAQLYNGSKLSEMKEASMRDRMKSDTLHAGLMKLRIFKYNLRCSVLCRAVVDWQRNSTNGTCAFMVGSAEELLTKMASQFLTRVLANALASLVEKGAKLYVSIWHRSVTARKRGLEILDSTLRLMGKYSRGALIRHWHAATAAQQRVDSESRMFIFVQKENQYVGAKQLQQVMMRRIKTEKGWIVEAWRDAQREYTQRIANKKHGLQMNSIAILRMIREEMIMLIRSWQVSFHSALIN